MISIEQALTLILEQAPGVGSRLTNSPGQYRIRPIRSQANKVYPYVTYQRISTTRPLALTGPVGAARPRFQLDVWSEGYKECRELALAIVQELHGFKGVVSDMPVMVASNDNDVDIAEVDGKYHSSLDFLIWHKET